MTFAATANAVVHAGGTPVLADVDRETICIGPDAIEQCLGARTNAVIIVHFAGRPCDVSAIYAMADEHDLAVIEDCAHAVETTLPRAARRHFGRPGSVQLLRDEERRNRQREE